MIFNQSLSPTAFNARVPYYKEQRKEPSSSASWLLLSCIRHLPVTQLHACLVTLSAANVLSPEMLQEDPAGPCPACRGHCRELQVHRPRSSAPRSSASRTKVTQTKTGRASTQHCWLQKSSFKLFLPLWDATLPAWKTEEGTQGKKKKKKRLDLNSPYLIKANLYFKCCFQHLHCLLILRTSFSSALNCDFEESGCRIMNAQPQGWEKACEEPWKLFTIVTEQHVMTKIKKHYIPARRLSVTIQVSLRTRAGTERRNLFTVNTSAWKYRARVTFCSQEDWH